jgi:hypothetical protein
MSAVRTLAALAAAAVLPQHGVFVPGRSLGGLRLGMTAAQVTGSWGAGYGVCRGCLRPTWYFTYRKFAPQGAGVELLRGRVVAIFTLWSPPGWRTPEGLTIGDETARITQVYGPLQSVACHDYTALVRPGPGAVSVFYVVEGRLWGFGLVATDVSACRSR